MLAGMGLQQQLRRAEAHLCRSDPVMRRLVAECGPCRLDGHARRAALPALYRTIIAQQVSLAAGETIYRRLCALYGGRAPSARALLETPFEHLRSVGLSRQKATYLLDLAGCVRSRKLRLTALESMPDEEVIERLTAVKGIGRWTAEVFMIFRLGRLDLLPVDDIGLLDGARVLYGLPERPGAEKLERLAEPWRPYRSVGCWYLWQGRRLTRGQELR